jgi:sugar phosphate isomerase/epimerase
MRLVTPSGRELWLAYGMNVHEGGTGEAVERAVDATVLPLRERLRASGPFGISLRLDLPGARALRDDDDARRRLRDRLASEALVPFTANGFVAGDFHALGAKAEVYRPGWHEAEREEYTLALAEVMAALRGPGSTVSISTSPVSFKPFLEPPDVVDRGARRLAVVARRLRAIEDSTSTRVLLGLEPEPLCTIETVDEAVAFFRGPLRHALGGDAGAARHLGICYDVCHQAVEGEDPVDGLGRLAAEGIPVVKVQASCALEVGDPSDPGLRAALARFEDPRWLHQVVVQRPGGARVADLNEALAVRGEAWPGRDPWRVHFHVPVHRDRLDGGLATTQRVLDAALARVARGDVTEHVEIETYTWASLADADRAGATLVESIAREYEHVLGVLESNGARRAP